MHTLLLANIKYDTLHHNKVLFTFKPIFTCKCLDLPTWELGCLGSSIRPGDSLFDLYRSVTATMLPEGLNLCGGGRAEMEFLMGNTTLQCLEQQVSNRSTCTASFHPHQLTHWRWNSSSIKEKANHTGPWLQSKLLKNKTKSFGFQFSNREGLL